MFQRNSEKPAKALSLALSLVLSQVLLSGSAAAISLPTSGKKPSFVLPTTDIIDDELTSEENGSTTSGATPGQEKPSLAPLKLKDASDESNVGEDGALKTGATINDFVPKGPEDGVKGGALPKLDLKGDKDTKGKTGVLGKGSLSDTAKSINAQPLALIESQDEVMQKAEVLENSEKKQIADLWESTLEKSPDIQFVVQKLVPTSDKGHATHIMMKTISSLMFGAIGSMGMVAPNQGTYMAQNFAASMLSQLNGAMDKKQLERMSLNQAELIMLYNMVRGTADKLVDNYRCYKKNVLHMSRATTDLEELRNMAGMAAKSPAQELEMQYTLRKAQRDIDGLVDDVHRYRQNLIDMAGSDAVCKLDNQVKEEMQKLDTTTIVDPAQSSSLAGKNKPTDGTNM